MAKLSKANMKRHNQALELLEKKELTDNDREFVFRNYHPSASFMVGAGGVFFTPFGLAGDLSLELNGSDKVLDVCAGIGLLTAFKYWRADIGRNGDIDLDLTCVELNPTFCKIGKKLVPWATWVNADIFDLEVEDIGRFDAVVGNPPFGRVHRPKNGPRYRGPETELHIIDHCAQFADYGAFIIPSNSAPFKYSGAQCFERRTEGKGVRFENMTGISLDVGVGIDCNYYRDEWQETSPAVEVVIADFTHAKPDENKRQYSLLEIA